MVKHLPAVWETWVRSLGWKDPKGPMHVLLHSVPPTLQQATTDPRLCWKLLDSYGQVLISLSGITAPFFWVLVCTRFCLCSPRVCFPVLCKFWWLYGWVNGDLFQESLCHTQVGCTQRPCPCSSPLLTHTSTGDTQTQFCFSLCGSLGPEVHKVCLSPLV